jgi:hypothetical protein
MKINGGRLVEIKGKKMFIKMVIKMTEKWWRVGGR